MIEDTLRSRLEEAFPIDFLSERNGTGRAVFALDVVPLVEAELQALETLDAQRQARHPGTNYLFAEHARAVAQDLEAISRHIGAAPRIAGTLRYLALVHDIGKQFLPIDVWDTREKPSKDFKALRRAHGTLGAAYLTGDALLVADQIPAPILACLTGQTPLDAIVPDEIKGRIVWGPRAWHAVEDRIAHSPFKGLQTAFLPLAASAALRHHEFTGTRAPEGQPVWLKLLALIEDLSGNMTERLHFAQAGRGTSLADAAAHMRAEGPDSHDLALLDLIEKVKSSALLPPPPRKESFTP